MSTTSTGFANRVEEMAQGPVSDVDYDPPPGEGEPQPVPGGSVEPLGIWFLTPAREAKFTGKLSTGVTFSVSGYLTFHKESIKEVRVRFGDAPSQVASLSGGGGWSASAPGSIKTPGWFVVRATVYATDVHGNSVSESQSLGVWIDLTDDVPPTVQIHSPNGTPHNPAVLTVMNALGEYRVPVEVSAQDSSGVDEVSFFDQLATKWRPMTLSNNRWRGEAAFRYQDGVQALNVEVAANAGPAGAGTVWVRTKDTTAPAVVVDGDNIFSVPGDPGTGAVLPELTGWAFDSQSGVASVRWGLNLPEGQAPATPVTSVQGKYAGRWRIAQISLPPGPNTIRVRATDAAGNVSASVEVKISVTETYHPVDPTVDEYFSSLVDFVVRRTTYTGSPGSVYWLTVALCQPFATLLQRSLAREPVGRLRITIEVLRKHFDRIVQLAGSLFPEQCAVAKTQRAEAEAEYRQRAYVAVLRQLGTSVDELSAVMRADRAARQALADRLGIELDEQPVRDGKFSNNLQQFLLGQGQFDEARLEALFGLVDFNRDPLAEIEDDPALLELQFRRLKAVWRGQDEVRFGAIIDPDVISENDLQAGVNPALPLLQARRQWLEDLVAAMRNVPGSGQQSTLERFDGIVSAVLGPIEGLTALERKHNVGEDITAELDELQLTYPAFARLMALRALAAKENPLNSDLVTDADWEEVYAILAQVHKRRAVDAWRETENGAGLTLGPRFFVVGSIERAGPAVSAWRTTPTARLRWLNTLKGRVEQMQALRQALRSAVAAAEEDAQPELRNRFITALSNVPGSGPNSTRKNLMVDLMTDGTSRTTRVEFAIQTLQTLLLALRTGDGGVWALKSNVTQETFDEELKWMGSYANWYSAMQLFLFPENHLDPALRPNDGPTDPATPSAAFRALLTKLRNNRQLTPETALGYARAFNAAEYGDAFTLRHTTAQLQSRLNKIKSAISGLSGSTDVAKLKSLTARNDLRETFYFAPMAIGIALHKAGQFLAALDWFRLVYAYDLTPLQRKIYHALTLERDPNPNDPLVYERHVTWLKETINAHDIVEESYLSATSARFDVHTRFVVMSIVRCLLDFADAEFVQDTNESLPRATALYLKALELLAVPELNPAKVPGLTANPTITGLAYRTQIALAKIRSGRNAAGLLRQVETAVPATITGGSPLVTGSGPFGSSSVRVFQPTPYRFSTLIERAKQLVGVAQQVEQSYLAALEKHDAEQYNLFKAQQDLHLANANVTLQLRRAAEAASGVVAAELQQSRAGAQIQAYQQLLDNPMNDWERKLLGDYRVALAARNLLAGTEAAIATAQAFQSAASLDFGKLFGGGLGAAAIGLLSALKAGQTIDLNNIETDIQRHSLHASVENRVREWRMQQDLARHDEAIGAQQLQIARDQQAIVEQEGVISRLQLAQAEATVAFLTNKFTNVELYAWMIDVLREVYGYFLQQATAVARLAQNQLAFESQQSAPMLIRQDYWRPAADSLLTGESQPDRRGLTGSARLLQDIYQLDQHALDTAQRKLQLSKTFSLARLAPAEFQQFRRTGVLTFATPMSLFDQEFPGHYLRLIQQVRTSVVALTPPHHGIRATLTNGGISRVVIGGNGFPSVRLTREPESVGLTSPVNATGLFELDAQPELMRPFELSGVDTTWQLEMAKAANPFDFRTIADVLITVDYTALSSHEYRQKVIQQLDQTVRASRSYSIRDQLPDQWYDLHNPPRPQAPAEINLDIDAEHFPTNLDGITVENLALFVIFTETAQQTPVQASLEFTATGKNPITIGGPATSTTDGIISTRIGNAPTWVPILGQSPPGQWKLTFPDTATIRNLLENDAIADIVLTLNYSAKTPEWPT